MKAKPRKTAVSTEIKPLVDAIRGLAHKERLQVLLHGGNHQVCSLRERAAPVAVQSVLIRENFHDNQPQTPGSRRDYLNILDLGGGQRPDGPRGARLRIQMPPRQECPRRNAASATSR